MNCHFVELVRQAISLLSWIQNNVPAVLGLHRKPGINSTVGVAPEKLFLIKRGDKDE